MQHFALTRVHFYHSNDFSTLHMDFTLVALLDKVVLEYRS